jgi:hypothetical protein
MQISSTFPTGQNIVTLLVGTKIACCLRGLKPYLSVLNNYLGDFFVEEIDRLSPSVV